SLICWVAARSWRYGGADGPGEKLPCPRRYDVRLPDGHRLDGAFLCCFRGGLLCVGWLMFYVLSLRMTPPEMDSCCGAISHDQKTPDTSSKSRRIAWPDRLACAETRFFP